MFELQVTEECVRCHDGGGKCQVYKEKFHCSNDLIAPAASSSELGRTQKDKQQWWKLALGLGIGIGGLAILIVVLIWSIHRHKKKISASFNSRLISNDPPRSELEVGSVCFGVPLFSYKELAEATDNFSHEKELGDGGFGRVYYAKLQDGREVAVKRFHEHNNRKFEQFMNEIEILTRLRHKNLVSLYGCTSRHSPQGLLLVYEFIPNGTVADHLRGGRAKPGSLPWPIRMNIAKETASALAYLHASDIIHRDMKTNNILLDNNFSVKVADFGLSRLFPTDVTHVSTAPQGSPGYVDPEYHLCYQLTDKSDVYSFGVVLIELISSMPPVDMNRQKQEINLAYLAVNRIQNSAIEELIDPCLGFQSDEEVKRMTTSVAELAFLCLQQNREMRPSMNAVLEELKRIQSCSVQHTASSPDCEVASLLKNVNLSSTSVTSKWVSSEITSSRSS
ncbi:LEAF RUST 10 DISEASE-RESISTANCE LOCUS RECEPTOR-LIKE PROTEIN KINASE-like 1.1 [Mangifera indica]|uniref:LEAF RUST 10 DISEASE-RESISTANCE LOCUS RECEPTOR-LIKE PROTEIN KINASE-like 1.1 n=1 Tax=Mangifera indica TaxID=29780 RepID=UPI001CFABD09|nr:LEAF RUST 10 DISEASE-RESISTANCE LOCUS RECEPTOR-LIKE PROTEIN KINASE-like 1.1 [Mangifera indica]